METRAPYVLTGAFVLVVIGAVFGFVYWLNHASGFTAKAYYRVRFQHSVSGMLPGAAVLFNGIRVGEVTGLELEPANPQHIIATIAVASGTPVRTDTKAGIDFQGLTGVAVVTLEGGEPAAPKLLGSAGEPPTIDADPAAWQTVTQAGRSVLQRLDSLLAENAGTVKSALANINNFSDALARNSDRIDGIVKGLERMTGAAAPPPTDYYDLTSARTFPAAKKTEAELAVGEPTSTLMMDTQKILVRPNPPESPTFADAKWADNIPKLVQAKIIQSLDNSEYFRSVVRTSEDLKYNYRVMLEIRAFQISTAPASTADVEIAAKIADADGHVLAARSFRAAVPTPAAQANDAAAGLDKAFIKIENDLVEWVRTTLSN